MKKILPFLLLCLFIAAVIKAQQKPNIALPDVNKMMNMTPAEREAYKKQMLNQASKQAKEISQQANIKLDESVLPDYELQLPEKDLKRIALIPAGIPKLAELTNNVKNTKQNLESLAPKYVVDGVKKLVAEQNPAQLQSSSIAHWYSDNPVAALLLSMESVIKNPDSAISWNNLAAFFNMCRLEHKSVPILKHWLEKLPQNSLLLNNMGQAWLGLGDVPTAEDFLKQCLVVDSLNPEANRSMAIICAKRNEPEKAKEYVKKEQQITQRVSTTTQVEKITESKIDWYIIYAKNPRIPEEKYFEGIGLSKFELPDMPQKTGEVEECRKKWYEFGKSISNEMLHWFALAGSPLTEEEKGMLRYKTTGLYFKKSERLFADLNRNYNPLLPLFNDQDHRTMMNMSTEFGKKYNKTYFDDQDKECARKRPIADEYMKQFNSFVKERGTRAMAVWKAYIDGAINILNLDPSPGNKRVAYGLVSSYFTMLGLIGSAVKFEYPNECRGRPLTKEEEEALLMSSRAINFNCPSWLNIEIDLQVAKLKADCEKFEVEAGKGFIAGYEKKFNTGTSTISAGAEIGQNIYTAKASVKQLVYVSFDNDNQFVDFGVKGKAEVSVKANPISVVEGIENVSVKVAGLEGGYNCGVSSGCKTYGKGIGIFGGL
jgi:hypothetical protein